MYLDELHIVALPERRLEIAPRERFVQYQRDLHRISGDHLSDETMTSGDQYTYTDLGDAVLKPMAEEGLLRGIDLVVFAYWTPEFDPDYSAFGPYFLDHYRLSAESFDVCDAGSLACATALSVLQPYMKSDTRVTNSLLLAMEQTTVPRNLDGGMPIPQRSHAIAAKFSRNRQRQSVQLMAQGFWSEAQVAGGIEWHAELDRIVDAAGCDGRAVQIVTQRTGWLYKTFQYQSAIRPEPRRRYSFAFTSPGVSALHPLFALDRFRGAAASEPDLMLIADHDEESLRIGWSLFHRSTS
ncbi:hypothetical protein WJ41_13770 [Burkholderia ubonensis]|uniref:hypothetical protein n=1 Tax=Burkholderia ubonensis TaxID=101571 RepID=UPI000755B9CE|nr:hypothetical protein [Burkholderia ubonensis]KVH72196.1 hypothetical protein WJ41_13770 [Burkholderia ubonensis]KVU04714.1 hypothetical protein WK61_02330 [Burkholderia ubonensis]